MLVFCLLNATLKYINTITTPLNTVLIEIGFWFTEYSKRNTIVRNYICFVFGEKREESRRKERNFKINVCI